MFNRVLSVVLLCVLVALALVFLVPCPCEDCQCSPACLCPITGCDCGTVAGEGCEGGTCPSPELQSGFG
jgi:hypothetical protein